MPLFAGSAEVACDTEQEPKFSRLGRALVIDQPGSSLAIFHSKWERDR
jgi:hypothetical protein